MSIGREESLFLTVSEDHRKREYPEYVQRMSAPFERAGGMAAVYEGVILGGAGVYEKLVEFAGAGATVPLTGFGNTLAKGVREAVQEQGILGALTGGLKASAAGIAAAVFFGFLAALVCSPKDKS